MNSRMFLALASLFISSLFNVLGGELKGRVTATNGNGMAGAIVHVVSAVPKNLASPFANEPRLTVSKGRVNPPVLVVQTGQPFTITSEDSGPYNFHISFRESKVSNIGLFKGAAKTIQADKPELFARVIEDLGRLHGYVCVMEHAAYALTAADGSFQLPPLPAGTYTVEAAHPREGRIKQDIVVNDKTASVTFTLPGRK